MIQCLKKISVLTKIVRKIRLYKNLIKVFFFTINLKGKQTTAPIIHGLNGFILRFVKEAYVTFSFKPKKVKNFKNLSEIANNNSVGIVLQGPIGGGIDFLIETVKFYKQLYPECFLVISTWDTESAQNKLKLENVNIKVLYNNLPESLGYGNINAQILSTYNGINFLNSQGCKYIMKTRTDCRIFRPNAISYMINLLNVFENKKNSQKNRIIACSSNTCKYRIYGITDILLFGHVDDISIYFENKYFDEGLKLFGKKIEEEKIVNFTPVVSEVFLCAKYLINIGEKLDWTLEHYWNCVKDYFLIIDFNSIDFFWKKYDWNFEQKFHKHFTLETNRPIDFLDWIYMYGNDEIKFDKKFQEKWIKKGNDFEKISEF